jgi:dTDP-4-amino-4,6-dideoxygalactose transaminase
MINVFQPSLGEEEISKISEVFSSNWLGKGKKVASFEEEFAKYRNTQKENMLSTTCATEGIFSVLEFLNLTSEDEVIVPSIGFVATASAVCHVGAKLVLCDVDSRTLNARLEDIEKVTTVKTKLIILNHYGGYPAEVDKISSFCIERGIILFEDAACAPGSSINGKAVGTFGDYGVWSFDSMKILVTGDGAMIYVSDQHKRKQLQEKMYLGLMESSTSGLEKSKSSKDKWWEYQISSFGRRSIMNDITASMGLVQLAKMDIFLKRRQEIVQYFNQEFKNLPSILTPPPLVSTHNVGHYLYWLQLNRRDELANYLLENKIYTTFRYWPLHKVDAFQHGMKGDLENTNIAAQTTINIPCHHSLTDSEVQKIVDSIKKFLQKA